MMDDPTVDADLFGDPSSSPLSDRLLGDVESRIEEAAAADAVRRSEAYIARRRRSNPWYPYEPIPSEPAQVEDFTGQVDLRNLEYIGKLDQNLVCPICHSPFVGPIRLKCDHVFCDDCLRRALDHQSEREESCPSCRARTNEFCISPVPKIISRILDDLLVKCPYARSGCKETLARAVVQDHVDLYCGYCEIACSSKECSLKIQRRLFKMPCLHQIVPCQDCGVELMERDVQEHRQKFCSEVYKSCTDCGKYITTNLSEEHLRSCVEASASCSAANYGCDFTCKRKDLGRHLSACPLHKLVPFLEAQNSRLEEHEAALQHMKRKHNIYEDGLANVQDTLHAALAENISALTAINSTSPSLHLSSNNPAPQPSFDSTAAHLLDLLDGLQNEVSRISTAVSELDARTEMAVLNQTIRANEEKLHRDAVESQIVKQLQWLLNSKMQSQHRAGVVGSGSGGVPVVRSRSTDSTSSANGQTEVSDGAERSGGVMLAQLTDGIASLLVPGRRSSESARQDTKL